MVTVTGEVEAEVSMVKQFDVHMIISDDGMPDLDAHRVRNIILSSIDFDVRQCHVTDLTTKETE